MANGLTTLRPLIFVIGPMNDKEQSEGSRDHTVVIRDGIIAALRELLGAGPQDQLPVEVRAPIEDRGSDIPSDVFNQIDVADLMIADISLPNPAVFYELAFAHSLGVPTILVQDLHKGQDAFYLKLSRHVKLTGVTTDAVQKALTDELAGWLTSRGFTLQHGVAVQRLKADTWIPNPITKFYKDVSLQDVSGAAGLALGYMENFIKPVMSIADEPPAFAKALAEAQKAPGPLVVKAITGLVIVKPTKLENIQTHINDALPKMQAIATEIYGDAERAPRGRMFLDCGRVGRRTTHIVVEGVAIDIPRTLYPLRQSMRLKRLRDDKSLSDKIEEMLIDRFADCIVKQAQSESNNMPRERLCIAPADGLVEAVQDLIAKNESRYSVRRLYDDA